MMRLFATTRAFHRKFDEWLPLEGSRLRPFGSTKPRREVEIDSRDVIARSRVIATIWSRC